MRVTEALPFVRVRVAGTNVVWEDERGRSAEARGDHGWPARLLDDLTRARDRLWRLHAGDRYHSGARVTLAVYVDDPTDRLGPVPPALADTVTRVEALPPPGRRAPATLPLTVTAGSPEVDDVLARLGRFDGIRAVPPSPAWWRADADILVLPRPPTRAPTSPVRLVLAPATVRPEPWMDAVIHLPADLRAAGAAVEEVVAAITHDLPLHDAVREAIEHYALPPDTRIWASPESDHALRISLVAARLAEDALDPARSPLEGLPRGLVPEGLVPDDLPTPEVMHRATLPLSFDRESGGLRTLASTVRAMAIAPRRTLLSLSGRTRAPRRKGGRRTADLRLLRPAPLVMARAHQGRRTAGDLAWVGKRTTLVAGQAYALRFQIGASFPGNLLTGPSPDFDVLLAREPDPEGHRLTVVLYPQDFRSIGGAEDPRPVVRELLLPPAGASRALLFPVVPPRQGRLQLRLSVYHRGSMLASYRLRARVKGEERDGRAALDVRCDYTRGDAFADPRPDEARDLHLAVNRSGGTHDLMVLDPTAPGGPAAADTRVTVTALGDFLTQARSVLRPMAESPVYRLHLPATTPPARLATDLHSLATLGRSLLTGLLQADRTLLPAFRRVSTGEGLYLQAVRHPGAPALPWALVYDWKVPEVAPATVCLGVDATGATCAHDRGSVGVVCARGFWGIRHRVEERVDNRSDWPERLPPGGVALALDPGSPHWQASGLVPPPPGVTLVDPAAPILAALDAPDRAPVFGILGHHAAEAAPPAPGGGASTGASRPTLSRVEVGPNQRAVRLNDLLDLQLDSDWAGDGRRPLVLLMACETAVGQEEDVYVDYLGPLLTVGAAGVVSTQTVVGYDLLGWTTRRLVASLLGGASLAAAMRDARAALLRERHSPLGFLFTATANGDLHLPPGPP